MDYKQKYEELIVRLKSITSVQPDVTKQAIEGLFPEIVDGFEDERIRKGLLEYFTGIKGSPLSNVFYGLEVDDIIAWLERQKSTIIPKFRVGDEVVPKSGQEESLTITKVTDTEYYSEDLLVCRIDEQEGWELVEQKHAEWSEEDEKMYNAILRDVRNGEPLDKLQYDWLKSLKDRVQPQPKQEWTMQDEEELQIALDTLVKAGQHSSAKWLKNVCLIPQNTWKPSGEQMITLRHVISGCSYDIEPLVEMEEQLKKLRGKMYDRI